MVKPTGGEEMALEGIVLPQTAREKPQEGTVVAVGPGKRNNQGAYIPMDIHEGDTVLFAKFGETELVLDGDEASLLREPDSPCHRKQHIERLAAHSPATPRSSY